MYGVFKISDGYKRDNSLGDKLVVNWNGSADPIADLKMVDNLVRKRERLRRLFLDGEYHRVYPKFLWDYDHWIALRLGKADRELTKKLDAAFEAV